MEHAEAEGDAAAVGNDEQSSSASSDDSSSSSSEDSSSSGSGSSSDDAAPEVAAGADDDDDGEGSGPSLRGPVPNILEGGPKTVHEIPLPPVHEVVSVSLKEGLELTRVGTVSSVVDAVVVVQAQSCNLEEEMR